MSSHLPQEWNRCPLTVPEGEGSKAEACGNIQVAHAVGTILGC